MQLEISDLAFAGFRYKDLLHVPRNLGLEFFYEFGKNKYWDAVLPQIMHGRPKLLSIHGPCLSVNLVNPAQDSCYKKIFSKTFAYASKVKAYFVVVHTNEELYGDSEQLRLNIWNKLITLYQLAHDYDVTLAVENVGLRPQGTLLFDLAEFEHLLARFTTGSCTFGYRPRPYQQLEPYQSNCALGPPVSRRTFTR